MENYNTHLAPDFTLNDLVPAPANVAVLWGLLGPGCLTASIKYPSSSGTTFPMWPENLPDPTLFLGIHLPTRALPGMELWSCSFSLFSLVPAAVSNFPLSLQLFLGRGAFPVFFPHPSLRPLSTHTSTSLPAPSCSPSSLLCAVYLLNSVFRLCRLLF